MRSSIAFDTESMEELPHRRIEPKAAADTGQQITLCGAFIKLNAHTDCNRSRHRLAELPQLQQRCIRVEREKPLRCRCQLEKQRLILSKERKVRLVDPDRAGIEFNLVHLDGPPALHSSKYCSCK